MVVPCVLYLNFTVFTDIFQKVNVSRKKIFYSPSLSDRQKALYLVKGRIRMKITENVCDCDGGFDNSNIALALINQYVEVQTISN